MKEFRLLEMPPPTKIEWFDINSMETEEESFTLGFAVDHGNFWIKNKNNQVKVIDINLEKFIKRGSEIEEILAYVAHNLQHDVAQKSNKSLLSFLSG